MKKIISIILAIVVVIGCIFLVGLVSNKKATKKEETTISSSTTIQDSTINSSTNSNNNATDNSGRVWVQGFEIANTPLTYSFTEYGENSSPIVIELDVIPTNASPENLELRYVRLFEKGADLTVGRFTEYDLNDKSLFDIQLTGKTISVKMTSYTDQTLSFLVGLSNNSTVGIGLTFYSDVESPQA